MLVTQSVDQPVRKSARLQAPIPRVAGRGTYGCRREWLDSMSEQTWTRQKEAEETQREARYLVITLHRLLPLFVGSWGGRRVTQLARPLSI